MTIWIRPRFSKLNPHPPKYHVPSNEDAVIKNETSYARSVCMREIPSAGGYEIERNPPKTECCKRCMTFVERWRR